MVPWQIKVHCWSGTRWQPHLSRLQGPQLIQSHISHRESKMYSLPSQGTLIWWCSLTFFLVVMVSWLGGGWTAHLKNNMFVKLDQISPSFKVKNENKNISKKPPSTFINIYQLGIYLYHAHLIRISTQKGGMNLSVYPLHIWSWWIDLPLERVAIKHGPEDLGEAPGESTWNRLGVGELWHVVTVFSGWLLITIDV